MIPEPPTEEERKYYAERMMTAVSIVVSATPNAREEAFPSRTLLIAAVFEKITSSLYFLREGQPPKLTEFKGITYEKVTHYLWQLYTAGYFLIDPDGGIVIQPNGEGSK